MSQIKEADYALVIEEAHGKVTLTQKQIGIVVAIASGHGVRGPEGLPSANVTHKILKATGWNDMRRTQMVCRFAYKHGLLEL